MQTQIERFLMRPLDIVHRSIRKQIGDIADTLDGNLRFKQIWRARHVLVRKVIDRTAHIAEEFIEADPKRAVIREVSYVPFSDKCGVVPLSLYQRGDCWMIDR